MNEHSESRTIRYYDDHADEYVRETVGIDMGSLYGPFLELLPNGAKILDAGCGSGRDSKAFLDMGYELTSIDASEKMVVATTRLTGLPAHQRRLQEVSFGREFDGIWASASLLHVPSIELGDILNRFSQSLQANGVCYISFKEGEGERQEGHRLFSDFTTSTLEGIFAKQSDFDIIRIWTTVDSRPNRTDRWVNALILKRSD
jgi:2-polyprenyl-3-methyl-5-hydroxy-6-metoxy-1,4-benzoquinol methylase